MSGQKIKEARKKLKMTQQELADKVGISRNSLSRIECGDDLNYTAHTAVRIAMVLGLSLDFLLRD